MYEAVAVQLRMVFQADLGRCFLERGIKVLFRK